MQFPQQIIKDVGRTAQRRGLRFGASAAIMTIALVGILVLINVLAVRYHQRWDLTASKDFSLSAQTIQIIQGLKSPVQITGFYGKQDQGARDDLESRLKEYTSHSNQVTYRFVDPDSDPVTARNYNITNYGQVVVESGGKRQQATTTDEQGITGALLKVTQNRTTTVYFLTGHRERSLDSAERDGYSSVKSALEQDNFRVAPLNLTVTTTVPLSDTVLVVADPQSQLQPQEEQAVNSYVSRGGRLMVLGNPLSPPPLSSTLTLAGLSWNNDVLVDSQSAQGNPTAPVVIQYQSNQITKDLNGQASVFPTVRTLNKADQAPDGLTISPLLESTANSEAVTDISNGQLKPSATDKKGPLAFGYSVEGPIFATGAVSGTVANQPARLVVLGDADFAANAGIESTQANSALFRNAIAWLGAQDQLISLPTKTPVDRTVFLTNGQTQGIFYGCTLGLPLLVLLAGVGVWWQRR